mmetsp:Transcript_13140/g.35085  ORF Transcript_13140/g.35085 Transcript_13140/m.35085 type:complete len:214 (-) Transcript_13140:495-1136(-)
MQVAMLPPAPPTHVAHAGGRVSRVFAELKQQMNAGILEKSARRHIAEEHLEFDAVDTDGDGEISSEELDAAIVQPGIMAGDQVSIVLKVMDADNSGTISFNGARAASARSRRSRARGGALDSVSAPFLLHGVPPCSLQSTQAWMTAEIAKRHFSHSSLCTTLTRISREDSASMSSFHSSRSCPRGTSRREHHLPSIQCTRPSLPWPMQTMTAM